MSLKTTGHLFPGQTSDTCSDLIVQGDSLEELFFSGFSSIAAHLGTLLAESATFQSDSEVNQIELQKGVV